MDNLRGHIIRDHQRCNRSEPRVWGGLHLSDQEQDRPLLHGTVRPQDSTRLTHRRCDHHLLHAALPQGLLRSLFLPERLGEGAPQDLQGHPLLVLHERKQRWSTTTTPTLLILHGACPVVGSRQLQMAVGIAVSNLTWSSCLPSSHSGNRARSFRTLSPILHRTSVTLSYLGFTPSVPRTFTTPSPSLTRPVILRRELSYVSWPRG